MLNIDIIIAWYDNKFNGGHYILNIVCVASDMSLAAKPTWTSRARVEEFAQMRNAAENLRVLAEWYKLHYVLVHYL